MVRITILFYILLNILYILKCEENQNTQQFLGKEEYNVTKVGYFECVDPLIDCSNSGICKPDKDDCACFDGFETNYKNINEFYSKAPRCNYRLKKQLYALILSLFISSGFVHFYLGNNIVGYIQFFVFMSIFIFNIFVIIKLSLKHIKKVNQIQYRESMALVLTMSFFTFIFFIWYIFDIFMVIFNIYRDSDNVSMENMIP